MFELSGIVKEIFEEQTFGSGFNKREFVVTTEAKYPQDIKFQLLKDKVSLLESVKKGQAVKVSFDLRGREWKGNYFVNLNAWKIESEGGAPAADEPPFNPADEMPSDEPSLDEPPF